jgi:hypothetical protein
MTGIRRGEIADADAAEGLAARLDRELVRTLTHGEVREGRGLINELRNYVARNAYGKTRASIAQANLDRLEAIIKGDQRT